MTEIGKGGRLIGELGGNEEELLQETAGKKSEQVPLKTVMVYWIDQSNMQKEPIGILMERRKSERDNNNAIGMLRLARKVFAKSEEEAKRIIIGDYV